VNQTRGTFEGDEAVIDSRVKSGSTLAHGPETAAPTVGDHDHDHRMARVATK